MGFGSYDESEQEQKREEEDTGESIDKHPKDGEHEGTDSLEDETTEEMLKHL